MKTIILDTESNGMRPEQICQLAYVIAEDGMYTGRNYFFSVDCMNEYAQKKHGFSKMRLYELSRGRTFAQRADEFIEDFVDADLICGHNIKSDMRLLDLCFGDAGYKLPKIKTFCTMQHFDRAADSKNKHGKHKTPNLGEVCRLYNLTPETISDFCVTVFGPKAYKAHDARYDTAATLLCILNGQQNGDLMGVI